MKNFVALSMLLLGVFSNAFGQDVIKYDFSKVTSESDLKQLTKSIEQENKQVVIDPDVMTKIKVGGMHYGGVPLISTLVSGNTMKIITDTIPNAAANFLRKVEEIKGLAVPKHNYGDEISFEWDTATEHSELIIQLINGNNLTSLGDKDMAYMTTSYKEVYNVPLANIHTEIKTFNSQPNYVLKTLSDHCLFEIILNDIFITAPTDFEEFNLNYFITSPASSLKIVARPGPDRKGKIPKNFDDNAYFSGEIIDQSTGTSVLKIDTKRLTGSNAVVIETDFSSVLPYYPEAWTEGTDLRDDKNLEEKISTLYRKVGEAFLSKDERLISDLFYQKQYEVQQVFFDSDFNTNRGEWEDFLRVQRNSTKYKIARNFDIEFNAGGKLIFTYPKDQDVMLLFSNEDRYRKRMGFFLYQPKDSEELKIVR